MAAAAVAPSPAFTQENFLKDYKETADKLGATYNEDTVAGTVTNFGLECFTEGTVIWRSTSRENDKLNYRFYLRSRLDTVALAAKAGYVNPADPMPRLATSWSSLFDGDSVQWCDLDPEEGVAKTWIFLKGQRSIDAILDADVMPDCAKVHREHFHKIGLGLVHFVAVDHHGGTFNIYFTCPGPITEAQAAAYTALAGCKPPTPEEFADLKQYLPSQRFVFAVTINYETGKIKRVAFYALNIPQGPLPATANPRLRKFFAEAPSYDKIQTRNVAWSYGNGDSKYMKGEASYTGDLQNWVQAVRGPVNEKLALLLEDTRKAAEPGLLA